MSDAKYTKEPWSVSPQFPQNITNKHGSGTRAMIAQCKGTCTTDDEDKSNALRIVACVNKCAGIQDLSSAVLVPAETLAKVADVLARSGALLERCNYMIAAAECKDLARLLAQTQHQEKETT